MRYVRHGGTFFISEYEPASAAVCLLGLMIVVVHLDREIAYAYIQESNHTTGAFLPMVF